MCVYKIFVIRLFFYLFFSFFLVVTISNYLRLISGNESIVINKIQ